MRRKGLKICNVAVDGENKFIKTVCRRDPADISLYHCSEEVVLYYTRWRYWLKREALGVIRCLSIFKHILLINRKTEHFHKGGVEKAWCFEGEMVKSATCNKIFNRRGQTGPDEIHYTKAASAEESSETERVDRSCLSTRGPSKMKLFRLSR